MSRAFPGGGAEGDGALSSHVAGLHFRNPVVLAAGTAAYGRELESVMPLGAVGGLVTKAVSPKPRHGAAAPRVAEYPGGMINAVGLANPGLDAVRTHDIPWLADHAAGTRVIVNVVGDTTDDYAAVVAGLDGERGVDGFELNVSCPNVKAGGLEFGADPRALVAVVTGARAATRLPLFVKLSPMQTDLEAAARRAVDAGADGITLVNTIPGLVIDVERRRPALGFGSGGVSGAGLLPVGVLAVWKVSRVVSVPLIGVGGVSRAEDVVQYLMAGASLVAVGTAALRDPRAPARIVRELERWCREHGVGAITSLIGVVQWPG